MSSSELDAIKRILGRERIARKESEKLLEEKSRELYSTNEKLKSLAFELEGRVEERTHEIATQNTLLTSIFESIKAGILFEDQESNTILVNQYLCDLFSMKLSVQESKDLTNSEFSQLLAEQIVDYSAFNNSTQEILSKQISVVDEEWLLKDGRFINRLFIPLKIGHKYQGPFWMYSDITYSKELENSRAAAEAGTEAKSIFLANMSHEIRTPLNGIIGMNRLLIEDGLKSKQMEYAMSVQESAQSLLQIINDILDFSKVEAGRLEFESVPFSIIDVIDSVFELLQVKSANKGLSFNVIYDPNIPCILSGDPSRIKQVLLNLVHNAIKFTSKGSVCLRVQTVSKNENNCLIKFIVEDTGIGISPNHLATLFSPFSQADATISRRFGGTGLGLTISQKIMEIIGGDIQVKSEKGKGSVFTAIAQIPITTSQKSPKILVEKKDFRVVITAANNQQCESIASMIEIEGISPISTSTVAQAISHLSRLEPTEQIVWIVSCEQMDTKEQASLACTIKERNSNCHPIILVRSEKQATHLSLTQHPTVHFPTSRKILMRRVGNAMTLKIRPSLQLDTDEETIRSLNLKKIQILLAEDNSINQLMERITLERLGAKVDVAANGLEVLQMINQIPYDIILMDIHMPELDGIETSRRIRNSGSKIPIVALTANAMKGDKERFLEAGMNEYLSKPLVHIELIKTLSKLFPNGSVSQLIESPDIEHNTQKDIIDYDGFLNTLGGDKEIAKEVIAVFCDQKEEILRNLNTVQETQDWKSVQSSIHRLCGSSHSIYANEIAKVAGDLEILMVEDSDANSEFEDTIERLKVALVRFDQYIQELSL